MKVHHDRKGGRIKIMILVPHTPSQSKLPAVRASIADAGPCSPLQWPDRDALWPLGMCLCEG